MNRFSCTFQRSNENTTCELYIEMSRLVRLYAANVLKPEAVIRATGNLSQLSLSEDDQLNDENLGIGDSTWTYLSQLEEEHDASPFSTTVRAFYIKSIEKIEKKILFQ